VGSVLYLLSLPAGWKSYRDHARKAAAQNLPANVPPSPPSSPYASSVAEPPPDDRPVRLN
jgi:CDP-diacylglycerol--serine O-phosphatidyltransferase